MPCNLAAYAKRTDAELRYIIADASAAAVAMRDHSPASATKYLDQVNDATTILARRAARSAKSWKCDECGKLYTPKQAATAMANGCAAGCSGLDVNEIIRATSPTYEPAVGMTGTTSGFAARIVEVLPWSDMIVVSVPGGQSCIPRRDFIPAGAR